MKSHQPKLILQVNIRYTNVGLGCNSFDVVKSTPLRNKLK
jgi:hypothetical protein